MPELPEVETTVRDLKKEILGKKILDIWTDSKKLIKMPFEKFKKEIKGRKIENIWRRGKNIIFDLDFEKFLLIHQKLTGHLLLGKWKIEKGKPMTLIKGALEDPVNQFIHIIFYLSDKRQLALSDLRKFAKVELLEKKELEKELKKLGPEPLEKDFTFEKFKEVLGKKKKGKIKEALMDQKVIAGIGNIYSDEILWKAKIHPLKDIKKLKEKDLKRIYLSMKEILKKAIELGGESISDYRRVSGEKGYFDKERKVYRREGEKCLLCGSKIKRIKLKGRSSYFCPSCQKI